MDKTFINTNEAAELLGVTKSYLYKLTSKGLIPFHKPMGKLYFKPTELEEWIENRGNNNRNKSQEYLVLR